MIFGGNLKEKSKTGIAGLGHIVSIQMRLNANSGNGGVIWLISGPPQWGRGRAITKLNKTTKKD